VLLVDKPAGLTSHDVVAVARRALGTRRIGHGGTLDPFATGLLVLLVGRATRLLPYLDAEPKVYEARIVFGTETDTDDLGGAVVRDTPLPDVSAIPQAIARLTGALEQLPPQYSAKRVAGERAYAIARRGEVAELRPARVHVFSWEILEQTTDSIRAVITCSGGTYIRALARDLGRFLDSAAHLGALRRLRSGVFDVLDAVSIDALERREAALLPPRAALPRFAAQTLGEADMQRVRNGNPVTASVEGKFALLEDEDGNLLALAERQGDMLQPRVVMHG
jgi:tRNA pseudouridine55 synthase